MILAMGTLLCWSKIKEPLGGESSQIWPTYCRRGSPWATKAWNNRNDILQRAGTLCWVNQVVLKTRKWMHLGCYVSKGHDGTWTDKTSNFILEPDKYNTFNGKNSGKIDKLFFGELFPPHLALSWWKHLKRLWFLPTLSRDKRNH